MKAETKIALTKELEKMKISQSKKDYNIAWYILITAIISLAIYIVVPGKFIPGSLMSVLSSTVILVCILIVLSQALFVIIRFTIDRRLEILFEALLDNESEKAE
jgi:hypothetical protein